MLEFLDTTLRDGAQHSQISYSLSDKCDIIAELDKLGVAFIEAGSPGYNARDKELFSSRLPLTTSAVVAFGATHKKGVTAIRDKMFVELINAECDCVVIVGKANAATVTEILQTTAQENLSIVSDSVNYAIKHGKSVIFDAEHFFDGYATDKGYAMQVVLAAYNSGAKRIVLCDTNGGATPKLISEATYEVKNLLKDAIIGIHAHNDCGLATTNVLAAIEAGATHVQGTILGLGERSGNTNLSTVIPLAALKLGLDATPTPNLIKLTEVTRAIAEITNVSIADSAPFVGNAAFAHKAGMHADGVLKNNRSSFEAVNPSEVGNNRKLLLSGEAGRHLLFAKLSPIFPELKRTDKRIDTLLSKLKSLQDDGYSFEAAEDSFILTAHNLLHMPKPLFKVLSYSLTSNSAETECTIQITIKVGDEINSSTAKGIGPVHALDVAMKTCITSFYPSLSDVYLTDYKVRVINPKSATAASVRVLISSTDGKKTWHTIGVSPDILRASFVALTDSYNLALQKDTLIKE